MTVAAIVLAAGQGRRLGQEIPKAFVRLAGRTLLERAARALAQAPGITAVLPVLPPDSKVSLAEIRGRWRGPARLLESAPGGVIRQFSVANGLRSLREQLPSVEWVLVHDAARALVRASDAQAVLEAARMTGAALPVIPLADTLKEIEQGRVRRTLERQRLFLAQTPQAFRYAILLEAHEKAQRDGYEGTDCASLVERLGVEVRSCPGRVENFKLTHPQDLDRAAVLLRARQADS